ncbi:hypothetical protein [Embleya sp. NBC_00896]|uniref:hypothetical protein n=1 Tax=Embleya sp. NBC_00896 TaxID=2975961 RepID=UPI002F90A6A1|nr:hypothetical protein OG928_48340 [Embleya sp. NBC_00896]
MVHTEQPPDLDEIDARDAAAIPPPWAYVENHAIIVAGLQIHGPGDISYTTAIASIDGAELADPESAPDDAQVAANIAFMVHSRQDVPDLLAHVRRLAGRIDQVRLLTDRAAAQDLPAVTLMTLRAVLDGAAVPIDLEEPAPTRWAYKQACAALEHHRQRADDAEEEVKRLRTELPSP